MEKRIVVASNDFLSPGERRATALVHTPYGYEPDDRLSQGRVKVAASSEALSAAARLERVPGRSYFLVVALGDWEHWGTNNNGDAFPYNALMGLDPADKPREFFKQYESRIKPKWGYKTFETGHTFQEHENSSPKLAIGGIEEAFWNEKMRRVELIQWVDHEIENPRLHREAQKILKIIEEKGWYGISMASRVPFDRCSVCHNLAPTKRQYCSHVKNFRLLRGILPDGTPVAMINDYAVFFDSSLVGVPAAPEARTLLKIAKSVDFKEARHIKEAEITKEVEPLADDIAEDIEHLQDVVPALYHSEPRFSGPVMDKLAQFELPEVALGLHKCGMALRPSELLELLLHRTPPAIKAAALDAQVFNVELQPTNEADIERTYKAPDPMKVARVQNLVQPFMDERSWLEPHYSTRLMKLAMKKGETKLAAEYMNEPSDLEISGLALYESAYAACDLAVKKAGAMWRWSLPGVVGLGATLYEQEQAEKNRNPMTGQVEGVGPLKHLAVSHPLVTTVGGALAARKGMDAIKGLFRK